MPSEEDSELWSTRSAAISSSLRSRSLGTTQTCDELAGDDPDEVKDRIVLAAALKEQERSAQHRRSAHEVASCLDVDVLLSCVRCGAALRGEDRER